MGSSLGAKSQSVLEHGNAKQQHIVLRIRIDMAME